MKSAIVLAAGKGTRMKSSLCKVMHPVLNKPMIGHIVSVLKAAQVDRIVVVVGHGAESVKEYLKDGVEYALQEPQLGTGHAVMQANALENEDGDTIVLCGDGPCIQKETILKAFEANQDHACTVLTSVLPSGGNYGRIVRNADGMVEKIVEAKDCSIDELKINEINTGIFCFKTKKLFEGLKEITTNNAQNEYYLTDLVEIFNRKHEAVNALIVDDADETMGVNDRIDLAKANAWLKRHINHKHMLNGVTLFDPETTYIDSDVEIDSDTVIYPNVYLQGNTKIGKNVTILPGTVLINAVIEDGAMIDIIKI